MAAEGETQSTDKALNVRQRKFVAAILASKTIGEAAEKVGVTERSGQRWMTLPGVKAMLDAALDDLLDDVTRCVAYTMKDCLLVLHDIALNQDAPWGARVSAARGVLTSGLQLREAVDLTNRLRDIEESMGIAE